jgi:sulfhydrogenase subunit beta (sulfur reductase)
MSKKTEFIITKENLLKGLQKALGDYQVAALTHRDERVLYDYVTDSSEIELNYHPTVLSPKKYFFPQNEVILEYTRDGKVSPKIEAKPLVLFGITPCDLNGMKVLNEAFADDNGDPNYLAKLEKTVVIGKDCKKICDKHAFCFKVNSHEARGAYDIMLYDLGNSYAIEIANDKGKEFVSKYFTTDKARGDEIDAFAKEKAAVFGKETQFKNLEKFPETFESNPTHPIWEKEGSRCLSCGSCIMVCPTCYCFDVIDAPATADQPGTRTRRWDACMLDSFAVVAGGENFRSKPRDRLQHRINRKFNYLMKKHGQAVCVGCGRCVRACLVDISPKTIAEAINGETK